MFNRGYQTDLRRQFLRSRVVVEDVGEARPGLELKHHPAGSNKGLYQKKDSDKRKAKGVFGNGLVVLEAVFWQMVECSGVKDVL